MNHFPLLNVAPVPRTDFPALPEGMPAAQIGDWVFYLDEDGNPVAMPARDTAQDIALTEDLLRHTRKTAFSTERQAA